MNTKTLLGLRYPALILLLVLGLITAAGVAPPAASAAPAHHAQSYRHPPPGLHFEQPLPASVLAPASTGAVQPALGLPSGVGVGATSHSWGMHFYVQFSRAAASRYASSRYAFEAVTGAALLWALQWGELKFGMPGFANAVFDAWLLNHVRERISPMWYAMRSCASHGHGFQVGAHVTWWLSINSFAYQCI